MVIDFNEYVEKKRVEREKIEAELTRERAAEDLARAYSTKGLKAFFDMHGLVWDADYAEHFYPLMEEAISMGLTAGQIEEMLIAVLLEDEEDEEDPDA